VGRGWEGGQGPSTGPWLLRGPAGGHVIGRLQLRRTGGPSIGGEGQPNHNHAHGPTTGAARGVAPAEAHMGGRWGACRSPVPLVEAHGGGAFCVCCAVFWSPRPCYVVLRSRVTRDVLCAAYCPYRLRFAYQILAWAPAVARGTSSREGACTELELARAQHMCSPFTKSQEASGKKGGSLREEASEARQGPCGSPWMPV
jgi:hypothetical protein